MKLEAFKNKKILIIGKGIEGESALSYFKKHFPDNIIEIVDQKDGVDYLDKQHNFDVAIKSPGVKAELISIPYTTVTNVFLSNAKGKVIGVTGTKGKSTTSTLIYEMLKKEGRDVYLGGNIGKPSLDFLDNLNDQSWTVLEMSSFQLKDIKISPHIAVMLMISQEHLDYHKTLEDYISSKRNILKFQTENDYAVINRDYLPSNESDIHTNGKTFSVSTEREYPEGIYIKEGSIWLGKNDNKEKIMQIEDVCLLGRHNLENVCAAAMAAFAAGVSKENIVAVIKEFGGLEHRLEFVMEKGGIRFINDSLATIPEATMRALETFPDTETLIAGGYDRGLDFAQLGRYLAKTAVKNLILFPQTGKRIWEEVLKTIPQSQRPEKFDVSSMEQAVRIAFAETSPGKTCLLSPASASFGIFKNYKDRGEQFKKEIMKYNDK